MSTCQGKDSEEKEFSWAVKNASGLDLAVKATWVSLDTHGKEEYISRTNQYLE